HTYLHNLPPFPTRRSSDLEASGYAKSESDVTLLTEQNLNVPITLKVGAITEAVNVTTEAPLVNTAETRNQLTLETDSLSSLPLADRKSTRLNSSHVKISYA